MAHHHHHDHGTEQMGDGRLTAALGVNLLLTLVQVVGGILSGSLSLVADALHNLSDAASLGIALVARKIGRRPPDAFKTFGYKRAEVIAALVNLVTLLLIGCYLIYQAIWRFVEPQPVEGWTVVIVAGVALVVDVVTAVITFSMSKGSMNIKATFVHNLSDAFASVAVILAGTLILLYGWYWTDTVLTLAIAGYVLWQGIAMLPETIHLLMEGTPSHLAVEEVIAAMETVAGVENIHHVHIWQLDEHRNALEAHVVVRSRTLEETERVKRELKAAVAERFDVTHSTLEFEHPEEACADPGPGSAGP
ncbi:MAG: cation diffusion facilitator family transporter [Synergistales bacterium]|nr:cation diffusion facilitator family transporter [Synergistales bacterium]